MTDVWAQQLEAWHDFYVILGSAAAGLTGLMFVVVSLTSTSMVQRTATGVRVFLSPSVVFFTSIVLVAAVMAIPPLPPVVLGAVLIAGGGAGVAYLLGIRGHRQWRQSGLDRLDWLWYVALPLASYAAMAAGGAAMVDGARFALHVVGAAAIALLVIGIRNAWDLVLWMTRQPTRTESPESPP